MLNFEKVMDNHYTHNPKILEVRAKYEMDNIFIRCTRVNRLLNAGVDKNDNRVQRIIRGAAPFVKRYKFLQRKLESGANHETTA